jgi:hypothetical protein
VHAHASAPAPGAGPTVPAAPPMTIHVVVRALDVEGSPAVLVAPTLASEAITAEPCPAPSLAGMPEDLGATLDSSTATIPATVYAILGLAADSNDRAYLLTSYLATGGGTGGRLFAASGPVFDAITEVPSPLVALAPGRGDGPTLAWHALPDAVPDVVVRRFDTDLHEAWSHTLPAPRGLLVPTVATSGARVLVGLQAAIPLSIDGAGVEGAPTTTNMLLAFDTETGTLLAMKGDLDATAATGLDGGAFVVVDRDSVLHVLEADLSERWSVPIEGPFAAARGRVWITARGSVLAYAPDGTIAQTIPNLFEAPGNVHGIAPLPDGGVLLGATPGALRGGSDGVWVGAELPRAAVAWCSANPSFVVAPTSGGALLAARPQTAEEGSGAGRGVLGRLAVP